MQIGGSRARVLGPKPIIALKLRPEHVMPSLADFHSRLVEAFDRFKNLLPLASLGGTPYSVDEAGVVKCVVKAGCAVSARMQIADNMGVDLPHVDHCAHEPTGDRGLLGCHEWEI